MEVAAYWESAASDGGGVHAGRVVSVGTDHRVGQSLHLALLYSALYPDENGEGGDGAEAGNSSTQDVHPIPPDRIRPTTPQFHHQAPQTVHHMEAPAQGGAGDREAHGAATLVKDGASEERVTQVDKMDVVGCTAQGYGISYDPPLPRVLSGRLLARVVRVEFDPAHLRSSIVEKALAAGVDSLLPEEARDNAHRLEREYERILRHAEYISRRRTALQAFEEEMDVPTAICLAEAAKRDPQYAALRRRLRQVDDRYKVKGDQSSQFSQLMEFLRGTTPAPETIMGGNNGGNGNGDEQSRYTREDDEDETESGELRFGGDDEESV